MKKTMKRSLALGALMAFVITGSAMAADGVLEKAPERQLGTVTVDGIKADIDNIDEKVVIGESDSSSVDISASGTYQYKDDKGEVKTAGYRAVWLSGENNIGEVYGKNITITSKDGRGVQVGSKAKLSIGNDTTENISITAGGDTGLLVLEGHANLQAKNIEITCTGDGAGVVWVQNNTEHEKAPEGAASVNLKADNIKLNSNDIGIAAFSNSQVNVEGNLTINAKNNALDVRGNSTVNINKDGKHTTVLNGDIVFETPNNEDNSANSGKLLNSNVNINLNGDGSVWTGRAYQEYQVKENGQWKYVHDISLGDLGQKGEYGKITGFKLNIANGASWNMTGDSFINGLELGQDGVVNVKEGVKEFNADAVAMNGGIVNMEGSGTQVSINTLTGDNAVVSTASLENQVSIRDNQNKNVVVNGSGAIADQIAADNNKANDLANVVVSGDKTAANKITTDEGVIGGRYEGTVDKNGKVTGFQAKNSTNTAISEMGSIALMAWRQENNDMNKRLGELRNSNGEHGIWTRMTRGESEFKSVKNQYNAYQIGYDEKLSTDKSWTVGAALTYTDAQSSFAGGSGENTHKGFAVYGSKLNEDGSFIDLIAKYARLEHEFDAVGGIGKGEYDTNGYSVSAEYGKRFDKGNGFWVEPQVELTYGKVGSVNYATDKAMAYQDGMESLVGRVGFSLGKDIKDGNVYVRASYLYDFDGETEVTMMSKDGKASDTYEQDLGGGWFEVGVGTNINLSDATYVYFDVEKTYGGDVATPWQWNAGVRYSF